MSWLTRGWSITLALAAALTVGAALVLAARRRGEVWHTLDDQN
jgi:hypothetical protein